MTVLLAGVGRDLIGRGGGRVFPGFVGIHFREDVEEMRV